MSLLSIQDLDAQYQETAACVLARLFHTAFLTRDDLDQAEKGSENTAPIAKLRWLLRSYTIDKRLIHQAMQELDENMKVSEMLQFTNFLAPPQKPQKESSSPPEENDWLRKGPMLEL
ncbi:MAG: hypothetical protein A3C02_04095 [Candidatus Andersenbacteria bacterium RIFCSPHIGHO2_02_FULL_45_11]|uniref:Uncharacterized protein n=1 Tax=Candidatus Andersenbacteria bacterium RIFCSPHIGHO2_12_FULL_45_11 TaxID=1797281 RepID=A0A1G1X0I6_9BACT|nr:MAG: hypothetical protein A2805_00805 [Candidatus Andersenbacteria bacterium RIFCSPHIGHO2_01_FULL_46_36]OGY33070.1 MAG: hypothetical protein A3D99_01275 [Candidatus Andersenbacteria bacterium RIFCSPHIGHO2_12_FULL_45_11]OGY33411.1 MAG: hypothetical protein A3C02_04095 [Candidatus Andersenbacteria bacterium RIFCSPHIGHO2_02_FULL_45_11]